jgi:enamine deaminase RidA (YjgF/YER057c/UK114 family)
MMTRTDIRSINPNVLSKLNADTHVVEVQGGKTVYISNQVMLGADDFEVQVRETFGNIQAGLKAMRLYFLHVVKPNLYVLNISHPSILRRAWDEFVNLEYLPPSRLVRVAALFRTESVFEAAPIAVAPE